VTRSCGSCVFGLLSLLLLLFVPGEFGFPPHASIPHAAIAAATSVLQTM
jgi:hypothetical protein